MNIGLIADIHADFDALKIALDILEGQGAGTIICAGDLVGKGPKGNAVVELIRQRKIPCVMGNHDNTAPTYQELFRQMGDAATSRQREAHLLKDETVTFVSTLPPTLRLEWEGKRVLLAHGTPWSFDEYLFPYSAKDAFERVAQAAVDAAKADVVVLGHTHEPMAAQVHDLWIVNPGSVCGTYADGTRTCGILSLPSCNLRLYDIGSATRLRIPYLEY